MSRPLGELAQLIMLALQGGPSSARGIADELGQPIDDVVKQLHRLTASGRVRVLELQPRPPARRPVAVFCIGADAPRALPFAWPAPRMTQP